MAQEATRRGVLAAAGLAATGLALPVLTSGCKGIGALGTPPRPLPDVAVATDAITGERALIARYNAILSAMPSLVPQLRPILDQHTAHLERLRSRLSDPGAAARPSPVQSSPTTSRGTRTAAGGAGTGTPPPVPSTPAAALAALRTAEDTASAALLGHLPSVSPSFAQLLASISASEASHALLLRTHGHAQ